MRHQLCDQTTGPEFIGNQIVCELLDECVVGVLELTTQSVAGDAADETVGKVARFLFEYVILQVLQTVDFRTVR